MADKKYSFDSLKQFQSLPLDAKISMARKRINNWYNHYDGNCYVSFSGGKDSTVLVHLIESMGLDIPLVFVNTGLEFPEVRRFATSHKNVTVLTPALTFKQVLETYGYPVISKEQALYIEQYRNTKSEHVKEIRLNGNANGRFKISNKWKFMLDAPFKISARCCSYLKKQPLIKYERETGRKPFIATLACESNLRLSNWLRYGCNAFDMTRPLSTPLSVWTEQDILAYIARNNVPIASVYGDLIQDADGCYHLTGEQRTGCMFCMFGVHLEPEPNKFQRMAVTHPRQYAYCMKELGLENVLSFMQIPFKPVPTLGVELDYDHN